MRQDISRMGKRGRKVLMPVFIVIMWSQARKELAIGFPNIINSGGGRTRMWWLRCRSGYRAEKASMRIR